MRKPQAKGINFRSLVGALRRIRGEDKVARVFDLLPEEIGGPLRIGAITTGGWYPIEWYSKLHTAAQKACGEGIELSRELARNAVHDDFKAGAYRLITVSLSPQSLLKLAQRVMSLYWDAGRVVIEQAEPGRVMGRFDGYHGFDRNVWEDIVGGTMGVLEIGGGKDVHPRIVAGGGDGDDHMVYVVRWTT